MKFENNPPVLPKVNATFRLSAELKQELSHQARSSGMEISPYCEMLVANAAKYIVEIGNLRSELTKVETDIASVSARHTLEKNSLLRTLEVLQEENSRLKIELEKLQKQSRVFSDPRLLEIFERVKGRTNTVERTDGTKFTIRYDSPLDVVVAMIHSFDYKN